MQHHPKFVWLMRTISIYRLQIKMGEFGSETEKPAILFSNSQEALNRILDFKTRTWNRNMKTQSLVRYYETDDGRVRVAGDTKMLKKSQADCVCTTLGNCSV